MATTDFANLLSAVPQLSPDQRALLLQALTEADQVASAVEETEAELAERAERRAKWFAELDAAVVEGPKDGWSNRDHDKLLYGDIR